MSIIQNVRGNRRNILIQNDRVFVNNVEVFGAKAEALRKEAGDKLNTAFKQNPQNVRGKSNTDKVVIVQHACKIVNISGDVTIDATGKMKITSREQ